MKEENKMSTLAVIAVIAAVIFVKWKFFRGEQDPFNRK